MANTLAPYGFRLYNRMVAATGSVAVVVGKAAGGTISASGPIPIASATTLKVQDPIKVSAGVGYLAGITGAVYGVLNSAVPGYSETATQKHYPEILPADDQSIWVCQSTKSTINVTQGYIGVAGKKYWLGGTTSGYMGIDFSHTTNGNLVVVGFAPWSAPGTFAEVLEIFTRGVFYGQS